MKFTIQRFHGGRLVIEMTKLCHDHIKKTVLLVWGAVPTTLEEGGEVGEEWKLSIGEGHWVVVTRTA